MNYQFQEKEKKPVGCPNSGDHTYPSKAEPI